jgi:hypothetical protein
MTKKERILAVAAALLALSLIPIPYLASPDWNVRVVDSRGNQARGVTVRLSYTNYSVEANGHEEDRVTDEHGYAHFDAHRRAASLLQRCWFTALSATSIAHASFGNHDWVFAFGYGLEGYAVSNGVVTDWAGKPEHMESLIILEALPR